MHSGMTFRTVLGEMTYNSKGDRTNLDYTVYRWNKGTEGTITYLEITKK
jgi:branched-chain amino acid transport system substrate-binding protein